MKNLATPTYPVSGGMIVFSKEDKLKFIPTVFTCSRLSLAFVYF